MLSFANGKPQAWQTQVQNACMLHAKNDLPTFAFDASIWAKAQGIHVEEVDHVGVYRSTVEDQRKGKGGLFVPHHWRRYAAHVLGLTVSDEPPHQKPDVRRQSQGIPEAAVIAQKKMPPPYYRAPRSART